MHACMYVRNLCNATLSVCACVCGSGLGRQSSFPKGSQVPLSEDNLRVPKYLFKGILSGFLSVYNEGILAQTIIVLPTIETRRSAV